MRPSGGALDVCSRTASAAIASASLLVTALAVEGCSSSSGASTDDPSQGQAPARVVAAPAPVRAESNAAKPRLAAIRRQFNESSRDRLAKDMVRRPVIGDGVVKRFEAAGKDGVRPVIDAKPAGLSRRAVVELPRRARD